MRVGIGYDVHKLTEGRDLILGGVRIPYEKGLLGHSDADVLIHAIMDALVGAAALGDIGLHFPDTDPKYKGISSVRLLEHVSQLLEADAFTRLRGLIYFTDGYGLFPVKMPPYDTVFVFMQEDYRDIDVPPWAMKLIL